ncbi:hypothetical protein BDB00DRAFT_867846 [Zychaea mexicana]|uniref:uncharacterized protein n=1 Tax=Zychaea mexicana TaxID=64656 RepID=UPI0022FE1724|nr:uncharacterized protein BDB00DRAFT_867846 [Zychaea mexicana]KAI9498200.1 hypothetical protein BDB00DRAFT_867846 [Zychaea mexicana]
MADSKRTLSRPVTSVARNKNTELAQLERRYRSTFKRVRLAFPPSDPDFPFELALLQLQLRVPAKYPKQACSVIVMNADIPKGFAFNLEKGFEAYAKQTPATLVRQMGWLDKNMETLLQQEPATTMRFVSSAPKPKPEEEEEEEEKSLIAPELPSDFVAAATATAAAKKKINAHSSSSSSAVPLSPSLSSTLSSSSSSSSSSPPPQAHSSRKKLDASAVPFFTSMQLEEATQKREKELKQLQARFRGSYKALRSDHVETVVQLVLNLDDPDFSYKELLNKELKVKYHVPLQYPLLPCTIEVDDRALGADEARDISYAFAEHVEKPKRTLFQNLNWLSRNLETILRHPPDQRPWHVDEDDQEEEERQRQQRLEEEAVTRQPEQGSSSARDKASKSSLFDAVDKQRERVIVVDDPSFIRPPDLEPTHSGAPAAEDRPIPGSSSSSNMTNVEIEQEQASGSSTSPQQPQQPEQVARKGTEIYLYNYRFENTTLVRCVSLNLVVKCARCKTMENIEKLQPNDPLQAATATPSSKEQAKNESWTTCSKCRQLMGVKFFSELMHQSSNKLGLLQMSGCLAFDILPSWYTGICITCMGDETNVELTMHGRPVTLGCFGCTTKATMALGDFRFIRVGQDDGERFEANEGLVSKAVLKRKKNKNSQDVALVVGQPLPNKGTCEHYRKSKRWFRFPCCSRLYPCDACHDKGEEHVYEMARRHVCGVCSREQAIAAVCSCGHEFERGAHGHFWEGGEGTRSRALMSRKDPHKYKGLGKTSSKKQERVGATGKNKRQQD